MSCSQKRISVLMINSPGIPDYGHISTYINYKYCAGHGYSFVVERCPRKEDLKKDWMWDEDNQYLIVWSKPVLVKKHLKDCDYLFFIDSDAIFADHAKTIEMMIERHVKKDTCLVIGEDCLRKDYCYNKQNLNAGSMLFVNNPKTIELLDYWMSAANKECSEWKYRHTREQMCLQIIYDQRYKKNIKIIPYDEINGMDGKWIKHYMDTSKEERLQHIKKHFYDLFSDECKLYLSTQTPFCPTQEPNSCGQCPHKEMYVVFLLLIVFIVSGLLLFHFFSKHRR